MTRTTKQKFDISIQDMWNSSLIKDNFHGISDFLRVAVLSRFGGAYFDTDLISRKAAPSLVHSGNDDRDYLHRLVAGDDSLLYDGMMMFKRGNPVLKLSMNEQVKEIPVCTA